MRKSTAHIGPALALGFALVLLAGPGPSRGQCLLANPSFEGGGGASLAGWNLLHPVGTSPVAVHGAGSARVTGTGGGAWEVSGVWQRLDTAPGRRWAASVRVRPSSAQPLTGGSRALLNIEWRDAAGTLLDYESHVAADPTTIPDAWATVAVASGPAPAGTEATHLLLGILQTPGEPAPEVLLDLVTFEDVGPPTLDELQWVDFPGGRTLEFSGRTWRVKGPGFYGPGPSFFDDGPDAVWVDATGRLHLTIRQDGGTWNSTEVTVVDALGYGDYVFTTAGAVDALDPHAILGLFLWRYARCWDPADGWWNPYDEIDVELGTWGNPGNQPAQFVVQPWDQPGNLVRFDVSLGAGELGSFAFDWQPDRVEFRSWRGGPDDESEATRFAAWTYAGDDLPRPTEDPRVHVNLWQFDGPPAVAQEVVLDEFRFVPAGAAVDAPVPAAAAPGLPIVAARPNPFGERTRLTVSRPLPGPGRIAVYDLAGRLVRDLGPLPAAPGDLAVGWDGRDASGARVASGVYLLRARFGDRVATGRVVRVR